MASSKGSVVVTGAARGIGAAIARHLASEGHPVVGVDLNAARLAETVEALPGTGHVAVAGDVTDEAVLRDACERGAHDGRLAGFVANAGIAQPGPSVVYPLADWNRLLAVNLTAPFLGARTAYPYLRDAGGGIVMIASINGHLGMGGRAAYCAAKAGVLGLVRSLAVEWAPDGVRVNAVSPGSIRTELQAEFIASGYATGDDFIERIPMGYTGAPEDIAEAVGYLLSDRARYVTGIALPVDGGWAVNGLPRPARVGTVA